MRHSVEACNDITVNIISEINNVGMFARETCMRTYVELDGE